MVLMDEPQNTFNYTKFSRKFFRSLQVYTAYLTFSFKKPWDDFFVVVN